MDVASSANKIVKTHIKIEIAANTPYFKGLKRIFSSPIVESFSIYPLMPKTSIFIFDYIIIGIVIYYFINIVTLKGIKA